jgi:uncharacterized protein
LKRIGLISDTHGFLDEKIYKHFADCHEIWHAGDIGLIDVTDELAKIAPLKAVYGNIDGGVIRKCFDECLRFTCEGVDVFITHIGGPIYIYDKNIREYLKLNTPKLFICGHSHILKVQMDMRLKMLYVNPGAAGKHGFHKIKTILKFDLESGQIKNMKAIELGLRAIEKLP